MRSYLQIPLAILIWSVGCQPASAETPDPNSAYLRALANERDALKVRLNRINDIIEQTAQRKETSSTGMFAKYSDRWNRERGYTEEYKEKTKESTPDPCNPQRLFVRADSLDNYLYGITPANKAKGAAVNYAKDRRADATTVGVQGMVSYVVARDLCPPTPKDRSPFISGWSLAPYLFANGNFTIPRTEKEKSAISAGMEAQVEVSLIDSFPSRHSFTLSPYYQTDFRGHADVIGISGYYDMFDLRAHLGGYVPDDSVLGWFIQLRGESDVRHVADTGLTDLNKQDYVWLGGKARLATFIFPRRTDHVPDWLQNRLSLFATAEFYHDLITGKDVSLYGAALKYNLVPEGYSSLAFEYSKGTQKETLSKEEAHTVKLQFSF